MLIDSNLFHARVGVYNLNMQSFKTEPNIRIKRLPTKPFKKSFKKPFFMLVILLLVASESITETNLTWPDHMFTIGYFINNFKHLLLILIQNDHLTLNFLIGT